jgi:Ring finger domain
VASARLTQDRHSSVQVTVDVRSGCEAAVDSLLSRWRGRQDDNNNPGAARSASAAASPSPSPSSPLASQSQVECPVCLENFAADVATRPPRTLPCGHSVCTPCVNALMENAGPLCPLCRIPIPQLPPVNFSLVDALQAPRDAVGGMVPDDPCTAYPPEVAPEPSSGARTVFQIGAPQAQEGPVSMVVFPVRDAPVRLPKEVLAFRHGDAPLDWHVVAPWDKLLRLSADQSATPLLFELRNATAHQYGQTLSGQVLGDDGVDRGTFTLDHYERDDGETGFRLTTRIGIEINLAFTHQAVHVQDWTAYEDEVCIEP